MRKKVRVRWVEAHEWVSEVYVGDAEDEAVEQALDQEPEKSLLSRTFTEVETISGDCTFHGEFEGPQCKPCLREDYIHDRSRAF